MTSILSAISGQFSKSIILGTFLPVALFVILGVIFLVPLLPSDLPLFLPLQTLDTQWQVLVMALLIILISGFLYNLNIPILRFYQGYSWKDSLIGRLRKRHYEAQYYTATSRQKGLFTLLSSSDVPADRRARLSSELERVSLLINSEFPKDQALVLPTRLGNVIRSFEDYPYRQYGMEGVTLWPRLIAKIDKDYAAAIDDSKVSFDFTINGSVLSAFLAFFILLLGLIYPTVLASPELTLYWLTEIIIFALLSVMLYFLSIGHAKLWGSLFKGAFDLYRLDLLKQLGYTRMPVTMAEERFLWKNIYQQFVYGDNPLSTPLATYDSKNLFAMPKLKSGIPKKGHMEVARGVSMPNSDGLVTITLMVTNIERHKVDPEVNVAHDVIVTDALPEGFHYLWNSARRSDAPVKVDVLGTNPMRFNIGTIHPERSAILTYRVTPLTPPK
jgi:hypothetical protein